MRKTYSTVPLTVLAAGLLSACQTSQTASLQTYQPGDSGLSCAQIQSELNELNNIITTAANAEMQNAVAKTGASTARKAAYETGVASSIPFLGSITEMASGAIPESW